MIEIIAVTFTLISAYLAVKNDIHTWWTGIIGLSFYMILFIQNQLPANATLQIIFLYQSIVGWYLWSETKHKQPSQIESISNSNKGLFYHWALVLLIFIILYWTSNLLFSVPMTSLDCITTSLSIIGNYLLMKRKLETWQFWILADIIYVPMFLFSQLYWSAGLYLVFLLLALKGRSEWKSKYKDID